MTQQLLDAQTRTYTRYASRGGAAEKLHAAFKLEHPSLSDPAVAAAAQKLYAEGAWTLDQVNDLVAMGRTKRLSSGGHGSLHAGRQLRVQPVHRP